MLLIVSCGQEMPVVETVEKTFKALTIGIPNRYSHPPRV